MTKTIKVIGIADCYGIESYLPYEESKKNAWLFTIRARANRHRHAVAYLALVKEKTDQTIGSAIRQGNYAKALRILKELAIEISLMPGTGVKKSWNLIPDPTLDPYKD
ncbi:MAG: hypothetical protein NTZ84_01195 [Candidatus Nealsonbacteria bacterium]|nr:hypothetical protein [Candidatus Nealsonbacteria bacterium]